MEHILKKLLSAGLIFPCKTISIIQYTHLLYVVIDKSHVRSCDISVNNTNILLRDSE